MYQQEMQILQGTVAAVVFQNYDNGYTVLRLHCDDGQTVTVVGTIPLPAVGERLMVTGKWSTHSSYGQQFEAEFLERLMPETTADILAYLGSRIIKGVGPKSAARIVSHFGADTLKIMEREPHRLAEVSGISDKRAKTIGEEFRLQFGLRHLMEFFTLHHLPAELAVRTYKMYGESTIELLYDDPYLLMDEQLEAPFGAVDHFAIELGVAGDDPRRVAAGVIFELSYNLNAGHSFLPIDKLTDATAQLLNVSSKTVSNSIQELLAADRLVQDHLAGITVIYLPDLYHAEMLCTNKLLQFAHSECKPPKRLESMLLQAAAESRVEYSPQQADAIRSAGSQQILLVTGGPGTGKTTIVRGILSVYQQMGLKCLLCAPTGRAAKRLSDVTGYDASTIHRLLGAGIDPHTGKLFFLKDENDPLDAEAVIVDEVSMVDVLLLSQLLQAIRPSARLILVGDPDQLPPVGPGFPFSDILRADVLPCVRLTEIFRQARESLIVMNAHRVNQGQLPELRNTKSDFFFLPCRSEEQVSQTIQGLCSVRLPNNMGIAPNEIQVLSPTKKGSAGTMYLNRILQASLNPASPEKRERQVGETILREGDRVMQTRNNYDILWKKTDGSAVGSGVFNGDVGIIRKIDTQLQMVQVVFDDREAEYEYNQLIELELAYAMTVHKSQGSEYRAVILSCWNSSQYLLSRSVLYTAITRAKEILIIVGREETVNYMTQNGKVGRRYSGLKLRLQGKASV